MVGNTWGCTHTLTLCFVSGDSVQEDMIKKHECPYCGKRMKLHSNMVEHIRTHTGEKPYSCVGCNRGFAKKFNLKVHMSTCQFINC